MAVRLSRQKLAAFTADKLLAGVPTKEVFREVAAHLVDTRRTRESELLVRDIEAALAIRDVVVADITTAHPLTDSLKVEIRRLLDVKTLHIRESVDKSVLGGVRVDLPGQRFDGTIRRKLTALKAKQL